MTDHDVKTLEGEVLTALNTVGELEAWLDRRLDGSVDHDTINDTFCGLTERLLGVTPSNTAGWEHLMTKTAVHSSKRDGEFGHLACKTAIAQLTDMLNEGSLHVDSSDQIVTLASALTLVIAAERRLRQAVELTIGLLCDRFSESLPAIAERCQDIWRRHGQMSGVQGPFVWDLRNQEWRLRQDFKSYRP